MEFTKKQRIAHEKGWVSSMLIRNNLDDDELTGIATELVNSFDEKNKKIKQLENKIKRVQKILS